VFSEALDQKRCFHALSLITSAASIPLLNQIGLDGSWVTSAGQKVGQGIQNHTFLGSLVAGYAVLTALKIGVKTLEAPTADKAKYEANQAILEKLTNAFLTCDRTAGDYSKTPPLTRFHQIMRGFDAELFPDAAVTPVVEKPPAHFEAPFKSMADSAKPGESLGQRYVRSFSSLSLNSVWLHALGLTSSAICYKIIPMLKLDGAWTKALLEKIHKVPGLQQFTGETLTNAVKKTATEWHVKERVGRIAAGYVAVVALKGLLNLMKAPNRSKEAREKAAKTLAQLSYAMHVVETRAQRIELAGQYSGDDLTTRILALPCKKAPLLERFKDIKTSYGEAIKKQKQNKQAATPAIQPAAPESDPIVPVDPGFANAIELQAAVGEWISKPTEAAKKAFLSTLSPIKKIQLLEYIAIAATTAPAAASPPGRGGTGGTSTATGTSTTTGTH
jgi:hypothetical protein